MSRNCTNQNRKLLPMLRGSARRVCQLSGFPRPPPAASTSTSGGGAANGTVFDHVAGELSSLHAALIRREASPRELRRQAQYLFASQAALRSLVPEQVSGDRACDLAVQIAAFVPSLEEAPTRDFFPRIAILFNHHLEAADKNTSPLPSSSSFSSAAAATEPKTSSSSFQHHQSPSSSSFESPASYVAHESSPENRQQRHNAGQLASSPARLCSSVIDCVVSLAGRDRSTKKLPAELVASLNQSHTLAMRLLAREAALGIPTTLLGPSDANSSNHQRCTARHLISFLRGADVMLGGPASFHFKSRGVPPLPMLPIKSKHDMERKAQKFPVLHDLLRELERRSEQITRIDAHTGLRALATIGVYSPVVVDACVQRIVNGLNLSSDLQIAEAVTHLGVLGHRHVDARALVAGCDTKTVGAHGMRSLLRGRAMLQLPYTSESDENKSLLHDHIWFHVQRPSNQSVCTIEWHIDVAFALAMLDNQHHKLLLKACRMVRNSTPGHHVNKNEMPLDNMYKAKLLWTLGQVKKRTDVPADLDRSWKENVNKVKNALKKYCLANLATVDPDTASMFWTALEAHNVEREELEKHRGGGLARGVWKSA